MRKIKNIQRPLFCPAFDHRYSKLLQKTDEILRAHPEFVDRVHQDLCGKRKETGDFGMTSEQVFRAAIIKRQNGWDYETLTVQCVDSVMTKAFIGLCESESYSKSCLQDNISKIKAETWYWILECLVQYAKEKNIENGRTVRMDSTVIESNIHYPTDSSLLYDCVRVIDRIYSFFRKRCKQDIVAVISEKEAKGHLLDILNAKTKLGRKGHYRNFLRSTKRLLTQLSKVIPVIDKLDFEDARSFTLLSELRRIEEILPLIIDQTERRVMKNESVPPEEKLVSIFEVHTDIIKKGGRDIEFGHKTFLTGGKSGLVLDCQLAQGNPADSDFFIELIERQRQIYGRVPRQTTADGGFASIENVEEAKELGVKDVCFSKHCGLEIEEMTKSLWVFQKLRNFRAGIEGVISVLKRVFGLGRVAWKGVSGFAAYVHSGVVAYNLTVLSRILLQRTS